MVSLRSTQKSLNDFILLLRQEYQVFGPQIEANTLIFGEVESVQNFPQGLNDHHHPGKYELYPNKTSSLFQVLSGPQSAKNFLFPAKRKLFSARKDMDGNIQIQSTEAKENSIKNPELPKAIIGLRACEIEGIFIQDKVFGSQKYRDEHYQNLREKTLIIAVNCTRHNTTCFCTSMKNSQAGPLVQNHYDIRITEVLESEIWYLYESGSPKGQKILEHFLSENPELKSTSDDVLKAHQLVKQNAASIPKRNISEDIKSKLYQAETSGIWEEISQKCLSCANCTMVCPTCFCSTVEDVTDVSGQHSERWLKWESCFTADHSLMHGKPHRQTISSRYRQWATHKFASWQDQFGTSGCTGCGKCITWCPVGIDITQELQKVTDLDDRTKLNHDLIK